MKEINDFSTPINKTAALVTHCKPTLDDDISRLKEDKVSAHLAIERFRKLAKAAETDEQRDLYLAEAERVQLIQTKLKNKLRELQRQINDVGDYIIAICRGRFSEDEWKTIVHKAKQLKASESEDEPVNLKAISEKERALYCHKDAAMILDNEKGES